MGWCDDPSSKKYNQLVYLPFSYSHEKLFIKENIYDIILVLDYNMNPVKKNKGSAIFIHVAKRNYAKTRGCIAINKFSLIKIIKRLKIKTKVKIFPKNRATNSYKCCTMIKSFQIICGHTHTKFF